MLQKASGPAKLDGAGVDLRAGDLPSNSEFRLQCQVLSERYIISNLHAATVLGLLRVTRHG